MRLASYASVIGLLIFVPFQTYSAQKCTAREDFKTIIRTVEENFYDKSLLGLHWEKLKLESVASLGCNANDDDIAKTVNQLLAHLKASHTGLYTPQHLKYWALKSIFSGDINNFKVPFSGIGSLEEDGNSFVSYLLDGSAADRASVRIGDRLESINGDRFSDLGFSPNTSSNLVAYRSESKKKKFKIQPRNASIQSHFLDATRSSERTIVRNGKRIGYVHLWSGTHDLFLQAFEHSLQNFKKHSVGGLIIDLRDGFGGANPDYLKMLISDPILKSIPKYFLVNGGVTSGKEWISAIIKRDSIGTLIGSRTAGAFLAGAKYDILQARFVLYLAVKEFNPPDIGKIEGVGVEPDIAVSPCLRYCNDYDPQLERALELAAGGD